MKDAGLIKRFELGYAPGTLKAILPADARVRRALRDLGLLGGRGRGREHLAECVVLPSRHTTGRVVELAGYAKLTILDLKAAHRKHHPRERANLDDSGCSP